MEWDRLIDGYFDRTLTAEETQALYAWLRLRGCEGLRVRIARTLLHGAAHLGVPAAAVGHRAHLQPGRRRGPVRSARDAAVTRDHADLRMAERECRCGAGRSGRAVITGGDICNTSPGLSA